VIVRLAERTLHTIFGDWQEILYYDGGRESIALVYGDVRDQESVLCRIHSDCISAHVFNSVECDCRDQMIMAQTLIQDRGRGVVIWLDQDGRGNGHMALMMAAKLATDRGISQTEAYRQLGFREDARRYTEAGAILDELGVRSIWLLSNSPDKVRDLVDSGLAVAGSEALALDLRDHPQLREYYRDKVARGHTIVWPGS
jgi:GTP cyclohydrolase II